MQILPYSCRPVEQVLAVLASILASDNISFEALFTEIIARPFEAILATDLQHRPNTPIFPGLFLPRAEMGSVSACLSRYYSILPQAEAGALAHVKIFAELEKGQEFLQIALKSNIPHKPT